jgi:hypothetical protein
MKFIKTASGKKTVKMNLDEWLTIGAAAGWARFAGRPVEDLECSVRLLMKLEAAGITNTDQLSEMNERDLDQLVGGNKKLFLELKTIARPRIDKHEFCEGVDCPDLGRCRKHCKDFEDTSSDVQTRVQRMKDMENAARQNMSRPV